MCKFLRMVSMFASGPGDLGSIPVRVIPKTLKMVHDSTLLNPQHYKVRIKGKMEQSRERSSALPYTLVQQLSKRELLGHPRQWSPSLLTICIPKFIAKNPYQYVYLKNILICLKKKKKKKEKEKEKKYHISLLDVTQHQFLRLQMA